MRSGAARLTTREDAPPWVSHCDLQVHPEGPGVQLLLGAEVPHHVAGSPPDKIQRFRTGEGAPSNIDEFPRSLAVRHSEADEQGSLQGSLPPPRGQVTAREGSDGPNPIIGTTKTDPWERRQTEE